MAGPSALSQAGASGNREKARVFSNPARKRVEGPALHGKSPVKTLCAAQRKEAFQRQNRTMQKQVVLHHRGTARKDHIWVGGGGRVRCSHTCVASNL